MGVATGTLLGPYRVADNNQWRVVRQFRYSTYYTADAPEIAVD